MNQTNKTVREDLKNTCSYDLNAIDCALQLKALSGLKFDVSNPVEEYYSKRVAYLTREYKKYNADLVKGFK